MPPEQNPQPSKLRPILPPPPSSSTSLTKPIPVKPPPSRELARKRPAVATACGACRKRKARCDGNRPICNSCRDRNIEFVYDRDVDETQLKALKRKYDELQDNHTSHRSILDHLRSRYLADAEAILQKIRRGEDYEDIAREIEYGDLLIQSSVAPETRFRYEFPLSSNMPRFLVRIKSPYLDSLIYEWASPGSSVPPNSQVSLSESHAPYLKPYHAAEIIDTQLSAIQPSKWTKVCSNDALMRKLLRAYFLQDHDWWTVFHKDYFLQDMAQLRHEFCSPLLVNALLALSCSYYRGLSDRTEFWNPKTLGYRFLAEARRLQEHEWEHDKITNIQAAIILHMIYSGSGTDRIGVAYTLQACAAAHRLGLFKPATTTQSARTSRARSYMAWALFTWQSLISFNYFRAPFVEQPPEFNLPDLEKDTDWYGEMWLKYPSRTALFPSNSPAMFKARAEFAVIVNRLGHSLFGKSGVSTALSPSEIAGVYFNLRAWYDSLPGPLSPRKALLPSHLKLHMHYFQMTRRLVQSPSLLGEQSSEESTKLVELFGQLPNEIALHAKASMEILLRAYYLRHGYDYLDPYIVVTLMETCLLTIANIEAQDDDKHVSELRSSIVLLARGIHEQSRDLFSAKLVLQLVRGKMSSEDAELLKLYIKDDPVNQDEVLGMQQSQMQWPVDIQSMADDPESKRLSVLVKQIKDVSLEPPNANTKSG